MDLVTEVYESSTIEDQHSWNSTPSSIEKLSFQNYTRTAIVPEEVLHAYFILVIVLGVLLNLFVVFGVLRKRGNDVMLIILQIAISDLFALSVVGVPEIWSQSHGVWSFSENLCSFYLGAQVFTNASGTYFTILLAIHIITVVNISTINKSELEEDLLEDATEMKSSRHSLVSRNEPHRNRNSEDTKTKSMIAMKTVLFPVLLIWLFAISLSIPEFLLARLLKIRSEPALCTFINGNELGMQILQSIFDLFIPLAIMIILFIVIACMASGMKYRKKKLKRFYFEYLKLSLALIALYFLLSAPRSFLKFVHLLFGRKYRESEGVDFYKTPPLNNEVIPSVVQLIISFVHFISPVIRPIAYVYFLRQTNNKIISIGWSDSRNVD